MIEQTTHLLDSVLPEVPVRQFVLTFPFDVRLLLAWNAPMRSKVIAAFHRAVDRFYTARARLAGVPGPTKCAAVCVAQRFSSDLRLNLHIHTLFADGVWSQSDGQAVFHPSPPLGELDVQELLLDAQLRIDRQLQSGGWQDRNDDPFADDQPALAALMRAALRGRTVSPDTEQDAKRKAALRRLPRPNGANCAQADGYSLHANTRVGAFAREDLRRLVKYVCRPAISAQRVTRTDDGRYQVELKTPYRDGTHAVTLSAVDLTARLGALMQLPRCPAVRYYGCFAPNARARPQVVKAGAQAPCRRNKPRDLDLAELMELARNVPEGAQERIERYVAQEVERRTSTVFLLPRRPDSASMYSAAGSLPVTGPARGIRHRHRKVHRLWRPARGHRGDPAWSHRAQDPDPPPFADDRGDPATVRRVASARTSWRTGAGGLLRHGRGRCSGPACR
jgi:hypothetical protein